MASCLSSIFLCLSCALLALQRHYSILQAIALDEDEMPEVKDETLPDEEGMARYSPKLLTNSLQ